MAVEDLTTLSPAQLDKMPKADLIGEILDGVTHLDSTMIQDPKLGNISMEETTTDAYGKVLTERTVEWSYYPGGEVDTIVVVDEGNGRKTRLSIKHYTDGRQPVAKKRVTKVPIPEPIEAIPEPIEAIPEVPEIVVATPPVEKKPWYERLWHTLWPPDVR